MTAAKNRRDNRPAITAAFYRGGTSKGVVFKREDLPPTRAERDQIFAQVLGSPDPYQRQLDGMGGGFSSVSKVVIVAPSDDPAADVDYTFGQVSVASPEVDYRAMCGNMASVIGPFAVEEGMVTVDDGPVTVRVFNTNTAKYYDCCFEVIGGLPAEKGGFEISGVGGTGAPVELVFRDPAGAATSGLLPSGRPVDELSLTDFPSIAASLVDATNPVVFIDAADLGLSGTELPDQIEATEGLMERLDQIRRAGGVLMGLGTEPAAVPLSNPKIAIVSPPAPFVTSAGVQHTGAAFDIAVRMVSMDRAHKAVTLTGAMCLGVAARVPGTIPYRLARSNDQVDHDTGQNTDQDINQTPRSGILNIGHPSGLIAADADLSFADDGTSQVRSVTGFRTQRRLMQGTVLLAR